MSSAKAHFPGRAPIDAYGNGGFRFADMSHRGSLLCLPSGIWGWPVMSAAEADEASLEQAFEEAAEIDIFLFGAGASMVPMPPSVRSRFREVGVGVEILPTGAAVRT